MSTPIHEVSVRYHDRSRSLVKEVQVRFGDGCSLRFETDEDAPRLYLHNGVVGVTLEVSGAHSDFHRAVNILRLHMPNRARV